MAEKAFPTTIPRPTNLSGPFNAMTAPICLPARKATKTWAWTDTGEWVEYTVNAATAGSYTLNARVASVFDTGAFHLEWDGTNVSGAIAVPNTGGWQTWQSVTKTINLTAGQHIMRICHRGRNFNTQQITFTSNTAPSRHCLRKSLSLGEPQLRPSAGSRRGALTNNGANVNQWPWNGANCQRWKFTATDNGYFILTAQHSNQALEIGSASTANGARLTNGPPTAVPASSGNPKLPTMAITAWWLATPGNSWK